MSAEENKALIRRFYEECNRGKETAMTAMEELYAAPAYVWHGPGVFPDLDRAGMKQMMPAFFTAFPDLHYTVEDLIAEGDKVVSRFTDIVPGSGVERDASRPRPGGGAS